MDFLSRPLTFRVVAAATAVVLGIGLIGAVTVDDKPALLDTTDTTTSTTLAGGAAPPPGLEPVPGEPGAPAPTQPPGGAQPPPAGGGGPAPTAAPPPASAQPGALTLTRTGLYRYEATTDGEKGRAELRVTEEGGAPAGEQRLLHRDTKDGDTTESSVAWRSNGVFERSTTFPNEGGGPGTACDWEPDVLRAPRPLGGSSSWTWDSRCQSQAGGQQADFHFTGEARVTGSERASVGGRQVDVWRIQSTGKIVVTGSFNGQPFEVVVDITGDDRLAPEQGVIVRSDQTSRTSIPGQPPMDNTESRVLQNLDPA